jgi:hypothetical protein
MSCNIHWRKLQFLMGFIRLRNVKSITIVRGWVEIWKRYGNIKDGAVLDQLCVGLVVL